MTQGDWILYSSAILVLLAPLQLIAWAWLKWLGVATPSHRTRTAILLVLCSVGYLLSLSMDWIAPHYSSRRFSIIGLNLVLALIAVMWRLPRLVHSGSPSSSSRS